MKDLWQQFKAFALKGNMIDLAIAVVIGAAFAGVILLLFLGTQILAWYWILAHRANYDRPVYRRAIEFLHHRGGRLPGDGEAAGHVIEEGGAASPAGDARLSGMSVGDSGEGQTVRSLHM